MKSWSLAFNTKSSLEGPAMMSVRFRSNERCTECPLTTDDPDQRGARLVRVLLESARKID